MADIMGGGNGQEKGAQYSAQPTHAHCRHHVSNTKKCRAPPTNAHCHHEFCNTVSSHRALFWDREELAWDAWKCSARPRGEPAPWRSFAMSF